MRARFLLPAVLAASALVLTASHDAEARRVPSRVLDVTGIAGHPDDSDPWVPDGTVPTKTLASPGEAVLDETSPSTRTSWSESWTRALLWLLHHVWLGGPVR